MPAPAIAGRREARRRRGPTAAAGRRRTPGRRADRARRAGHRPRLQACAHDGDGRRDVNRWLLGARPRTLPAAVVPVARRCRRRRGRRRELRWWRSRWRCVVSLALQIGVNYANDYSDGVRGTDDVRVGPLRLVAGGLAAPGPSSGRRSPRSASRRGRAPCWRHDVVVAARRRRGECRRRVGLHRRPEALRLPRARRAVRVRVLRTGRHGRHDLRRVRTVPGLAWCWGRAVGFLACALLVVNNLRDIPTDAVAGKRTLAVRLGDARTRWLYVALIAAAFVPLSRRSCRPPPLIGLAGGSAIRPARAVGAAGSGRD